MALVTRKIGLSLGADVDWPKAYEDIVAKLDLKLRIGGDRVTFHVERTSIEPYELQAPARYDLVIDRLTHWYPFQREWIKKAVLLDGTYVFNNPWTVQSMEKHTTYCAMMALGIPVPRTAIVPPKEYEAKTDLMVTLQRYAKFFDLGQIGAQIGYPAFLKPYDGGGWQGVSKVDDDQALWAAYDQSARSIMHLQAGVVPHDLFVRCIGFGPQTATIKYDPAAALHQRYTTESEFMTTKDQALIEDITLTINAFFGWDFNSCEALLKNHVWHPIDFANPCPDSQVTSLHQHWPWLVKSYIRWSIFCAATKRPMRVNLNWKPFFAVREKGLPYRQTIAAYARIARAHFEADKFEKFCARYLPHLDDVANEWFGSEACRDAIRLKVQALFPAHEHETFTQHFFDEVQAWRDADSAARAPKKRAPRARTQPVVIKAAAKSSARAALRSKQKSAGARTSRAANRSNKTAKAGAKSRR